MDASRRFFDYYDILGVRQGADEDEIKRAYRREALRWHPDRNPEDPAAAEKFKQISEAYAALGDPVRRRQYDLSRAPLRRRQPTPAGGAEPLRDPYLNPQPEPMADPLRSARTFTLFDLEFEELFRRLFWGL